MRLSFRPPRARGLSGDFFSLPTAQHCRPRLAALGGAESSKVCSGQLFHNRFRGRRPKRSRGELAADQSLDGVQGRRNYIFIRAFAGSHAASISMNFQERR